MSKPNPTSTGPQAAMPEFVSEEAKLTVIDTNGRAFVQHACIAREHDRRAASLRAERDRKLDQIKALQDEVEKLAFEASQEDHRAGQQHVTANAYAQVVKLMGAELPPLPPEQPPGAQVYPAPYEQQPVEAATTAAMHEQVWNGQTGVWANPAGDTGQQSVWDKPLDPQQEARLDRLAALKDADPNPDPEL